MRSIVGMLCLLAVALMIVPVNATSVTFNAPIGACFSYTVEFRNYTTGALISRSTNFACKVAGINQTTSSVIVTERWNMTGVAKNDSIYSHYYVSVEDLATLRGMFSVETKNYGGKTWKVVNATSGTPMLDIAHYDWYVYDNETGLGLAAYKADPVQDVITESWLTFYSENCVFPTTTTTSSTTSSTTSTSSTTTSTTATSSSSSTSTTTPSDTSSSSTIDGTPLVIVGILMLSAIWGQYRKAHKKIDS